MFSIMELLALAHVVGIALALGAALVKVVLLWVLRTEKEIPIFLRVCRPITRLIITGMVLVTASGIAWIALGQPLSPILVVKIALVLAVWAIGPVIDKVVEPRLRSAVAVASHGPDPATIFVAARRQYLSIEAVATLLLVVITVLGVLV